MDIVPYHALFVLVEYDLSFTGGDYDGVGATVLLSTVLCDRMGTRKAFHYVTGHHPRHIICWGHDDLYNSQRELVTDWEEEFPGVKRHPKV